MKELLSESVSVCLSIRGNRTGSTALPRFFIRTGLPCDTADSSCFIHSS